MTSMTEGLTGDNQICVLFSPKNIIIEKKRADVCLRSCLKFSESACSKGITPIEERKQHNVSYVSNLSIYKWRSRKQLHRMKSQP